MAHDPNQFCLDNFKRIETKVDSNSSTMHEVGLEVSTLEGAYKRIEEIIKNTSTDHDKLTTITSEFRSYKKEQGEMKETIQTISTDLKGLVGTQNIILNKMNEDKESKTNYTKLKFAIIATVASTILLSLIYFFTNSVINELKNSLANKDQTLNSQIMKIERITNKLDQDFKTDAKQKNNSNSGLQP